MRGTHVICHNPAHWLLSIIQSSLWTSINKSTVVCRTETTYREDCIPQYRPYSFLLSAKVERQLNQKWRLFECRGDKCYSRLRLNRSNCSQCSASRSKLWLTFNHLLWKNVLVEISAHATLKNNSKGNSLQDLKCLFFCVCFSQFSQYCGQVGEKRSKTHETGW